MKAWSAVGTRVFVFCLDADADRQDGRSDSPICELVHEAWRQAADIVQSGGLVTPVVMKVKARIPQRATDTIDLLSPEERAKAAGFLHDADRITYVFAHTLLRQLLSISADRRPNELQFAAGRFGKPHLLSPPAIQFSLSYRRGMVAIAVSDAPVGIDLEMHRHDIDFEGIAGIFFSDTERDFLGSKPPAERLRAYFWLWTRKEALVKAAGLGLQGFAMAHTIDPVVRLNNDRDEPMIWRLINFDVSPNYSLALAENCVESDAWS